MNLLFIITGSIAISRCYEILHLLKSNKIETDIILTNSAKKLINISKLKKSISGKVYSDASENKNKMLHINLSRKNNFIVVCPATANTIAKFANGYGDNLASTTLLASNKSIIFIPAMNTIMWNNYINKKNVEYLKSIGVDFLGPIKGNLKCGEYGIGRIQDTKLIVKNIINRLILNNNFVNKKCLITAGPTIEKIDPIRYISNYSSGKQGYEIADQLAKSGAKVILISGPTNLEAPLNVKLIKIQTAEEMLKQVKKFNKKIDIAIFNAAVADFKIKKVNLKKIKKNNFEKLELKRNVDILKTISSQKYDRPKYIVGFSAETEGKINAQNKLKIKKCDMIVYNKISKKNKVFGLNENQISIITKNKIKNFKKSSKVNCAKFIINSIHNEVNN